MIRWLAGLGIALLLHATLAYLWPIEGIAGARAWAFSPLRLLSVPWSLGFYVAWFLLAAAVTARAVRYKGGEVLFTDGNNPDWRPDEALDRSAATAPPEATRRPLKTSLPERSHASAQPTNATERRSATFANPSAWIGLLGALAFTLCATLLRIRYPLLGDNHLRVAEAIQNRGSANETGLIALYHAAVVLGARAGITDPVQIFRAVSLACGFFYSWSAWYFAGWIDPERRALIWGLLLAGGASFLFLGHVEVYSPLLLVLFLAMALTVKASRIAKNDLARYIMPLLAIGLAAYLHRLATLWIPAVLAGLYVADGAHRHGAQMLTNRASRAFTIPLSPKAIGVSSIVLLALGWGAAFVLSRSTTLFLRWASTDSRPYAVLSPAHLADYANAALLGAAGCSFLLPLALRRFFLGSRNDSGSRSGQSSKTEPDGTAVALFLAWFVPSAALFVFNPVLGAADVDLLVLPAPFAILFAARVLASTTAGKPAARMATAGQVLADDEQRSSRTSMGRSQRVSLIVALFLNLLTTVPWTILHHGEASVAWFREVIHAERADYYQTHPPSLHLSYVLATNGLSKESGEELRQGLTEHPEDPRFPFGLAAEARGRGDWAAAETWAAAAYRVERGYFPALDVLFDAYRGLGRREEQYYTGKTILESHRQNPSAVERYLSRERLDEIEREVQLLEAR